MNCLGILYEKGLGVKLDKKKAERLVLGLGVVVAAFLSAPTFAVWILAFLNAKPAWHKEDDAAEAGMENDMNAMLYLETPLEVG
ncbi:hypothetical protein JL720_16929 [Aureococcus anophagefferens]|nr:hypothetical protein JL720_16929 [Aureococcus anophagefferens]